MVLVIQPMGGADDWRALFHEAGHTEHYANTSGRPDHGGQAPRRRRGHRGLGDADAASDRRPRLALEAARLPKASRLRDRRRRRSSSTWCGATRAKLLYEIEFHQAEDPTKLSNRYVEILGDALKIEPSTADYLADIDSSFYVTGYLRSWAFEAQFRTHLRERWGSEWFTKREAGSLVRELWETGNSMTADEILHEVTGQEIDMDACAQLTRETLS